MILRNGWNSFDRTAYYQRLAMMVQNQYDASKFLKEHNIPSILHFQDVQTVEDGSSTKIYLATQPVTPIRKTTLSEQTDTLTVVGVLLRLSTILRDLSNLTPPFVHRGLDMDEIYLTEDNKILLSGFFYSQWADSAPIPYLPEIPHNIPQSLQCGAKGSPGDDLYMLASIAWSIFSGCPIGSQLPNGPTVYPMYAPEEIAQAIQIGLQGRTTDIMAFRKKLTECRKKLVKSEIPNVNIPLFNKYKRVFINKTEETIIEKE